MPATKLPSADTMNLKFGFLSQTVVTVDWSERERTVTVPKPDADVLEEYGVTPAELRADGYDVPENELEALNYALGEFEDSNSYDEWADGFAPVMNSFWPCDPVGSSEQAAALMRSVGAACSLVSVEIDDEWVTGIALTGGGMDLSDHLAAAYICCGRVPPSELIRSALRVTDPLVPEHLVAAARVATKSIRADLDYIDELAGKLAARTAPEAEVEAPRP